MVDKTKNNYISGTMTDNVEMRTQNSGFYDDDELEESLAKWLRQRSTTRNCKIGSHSVSTLPFPVVGHGHNHFIRARHCRNLPDMHKTSHVDARAKPATLNC